MNLIFCINLVVLIAGLVVLHRIYEETFLQNQEREIAKDLIVYFKHDPKIQWHYRYKPQLNFDIGREVSCLINYYEKLLDNVVVCFPQTLIEIPSLDHISLVYLDKRVNIGLYFLDSEESYQSSKVYLRSLELNMDMKIYINLGHHKHSEYISDMGERVVLNPECIREIELIQIKRQIDILFS